MIITKLIGGLGNQMFQYAAGRALAELHKVPLLLDLSAYDAPPNESYTSRKFELDVFSINAQVAAPEHIKYFLKDSGKLKRLFARFFPGTQKKMVLNEYGHLFYEDFFSCPPDTYLNGFWQCERYFNAIRPILLNEFKLKANVPQRIKSLEEKIRLNPSVSLHVRRGDYVHLKSANEFHGSISVHYYQRAMNFLAEKNGALNVFIFSDDISWCKENLKFPNCEYVEHNEGAEWDLYLMSCCQNNIIANSSFSWWGAWLNENEKKLVMVPDFWFRNVKTESLGIMPEGWILIEEKDEIFD